MRAAVWTDGWRKSSALPIDSGAPCGLPVPVTPPGARDAQRLTDRPRAGIGTARAPDRGPEMAVDARVVDAVLRAPVDPRVFLAAGAGGGIALDWSRED